MSREKEQIKIGLTGGIGSGKTFIGAIFTKLEIPVFNADHEARKCMSENELLRQDIQDAFGDNVYNEGLLQNKILADIVFNSNQKLEELNKLVHPVVKQRFDIWCVEQTSQIIIKEAAILFESNSHLGLDKVICVSAPEEIRIDFAGGRCGADPRSLILGLREAKVSDRFIPRCQSPGSAGFSEWRKRN